MYDTKLRNWCIIAIVIAAIMQVVSFYCVYRMCGDIDSINTKLYDISRYEGNTETTNINWSTENSVLRRQINGSNGYLAQVQNSALQHNNDPIVIIPCIIGVCKMLCR